MNSIKEYPSIIEKTAVFPKHVEDFTLAYFTIGLYDEISEFIFKDVYKYSKEDLIKEAGDVCWYACGICNHLEIDFLDVLDKTKEKASNDTFFSLLGITKKFYRDNKLLDKTEITLILRNILDTILSELDIEEVLRVNYDKLILRQANNTIHGDGDNR